MEAHDDGDTMIMGVMNNHMKGKRTKRRRPSPVLTLTLASTSSSTTTTNSETSAPINHNGFFQMPSTASIDFTNVLQDDCTTNDQDIASCLMLLAHGHHALARFPSNMVMPVQAVPAKPQSYVYECKTCDRGFSSFQALGGHRASHNKCKDVNYNLLATNKTFSCNNSGSIKGTKVHGCSICGSEFTSGQALGGHMRRHRSMIMAATDPSMAAKTCNTSNERHESKKHKTLLPLDLNLPAPTDDDHKETDNSFGSNNQIIGFSAPSLVNCP